MALTLTTPIDLAAASPRLVAWVQQRLVIGGYLPIGSVDSIVGDRTLKAFAEFKEDVYLGNPRMIGQSSIDLLKDLEPPHPTSEQANFDQKPDPNAGSKTGKQITLPVLGRKFLNEWIVPHSFLSFAEFTHGGTRIPTTDEQIHNMLQIAEHFGTIRRKFASPIATTSAFRPESVNKKVGGAKNSFHTRAAALDIYPINGNMRDLTEVIKASAVGGIGIASGFRHIDLGKRRYWRYGR